MYLLNLQKLVPEAFTKTGNIQSLGDQKVFKLEETPGFGISVFTALLPVLLMAVATIITLLQKQWDSKIIVY